MCLITDKIEKQIATEDMIVFKGMSRNLISPFQGFEYTLDTLFETELVEASRGGKNNNGWSCCCDLDYNYLIKNYGNICSNNPKLISIKRGFSSGLTKETIEEMLNPDWGDVIFECTIPKGSEYYTDSVGFVISNKIIINKLAN